MISGPLCSGYDSFWLLALCERGGPDVNIRAIVWYKPMDMAQMQQLKIEAGQNFEIHDGFVSYEPEARRRVIIPMARIDHIEVNV